MEYGYLQLPGGWLPCVISITRHFRTLCNTQLPGDYLVLPALPVWLSLLPGGYLVLPALHCIEGLHAVYVEYRYHNFLVTLPVISFCYQHYQKAL